MIDDEYSAKLTKAMRELHEKKVPKARYGTPLFRFFRMLGFKMKPPFYYPDVPYFLCCAGYFTVCWSLLMWVASLASPDLSVSGAAGFAIFAGALFAFIMVMINRYYRKEYALTPWDEL